MPNINERASIFSKRKVKFVLMPVIFIVSFCGSCFAMETLFAAILGDDFAPILYMPDIEKGNSLIPGADGEQISYFPFEDAEPEDWIKSIYYVRINSSGFRGPELIPNDEKMLRVMSLGDSCTFGHGEEEENVYTSLLEKRLSEKLPAKVFNLGVSGYSTTQGLMVFARMVNILNPNVVTVAYGTNDAADVLFLPPFWVLPRKPDKEIFGKPLKLSAKEKAYFHIERFIITKFGSSAVLAWVNRTFFIESRARMKERSGICRVPENDYMKNLEEFIDLSRKHNAKPIILTICVPDQYVEAARQAASAKGAPFIDTRELFKGTPSQFELNPEYEEQYEIARNRLGEENINKYPFLLFTNDGCHPNALGHKIISDAIYEEIRKMMEVEDRADDPQP